MQFTHIRLRNWRNFARVDVALPRRVFLIGPNASGKSNFLDAFRFLRDIVAVGGGFQNALQTRGGVSALRALAARESSDIEVQVNMGDDDNPSAWEYELHFNQDKQRRFRIKSERVARNGTDILNRPDESDITDPERLTQTYLEQVYANQEFREISKFFGSVKYLHIVPQLVREPDRSVGRINDPYGGDFLEQIANTAERTRKSYLRRIQEALKVAVPQLLELKSEKDNRGISHLQARYKNWRPKGVWLNEDQFSDGTLRLMGLLWAMLNGDGPLLLEEPELSLHPSIVGMIPQMFARVQRTGRQILISTHSLGMLNDDGIGIDEVLMLFPQGETTIINTIDQIDQIKPLLGSDIPLGDILVPLTRPEGLDQLPLFADK